MAVKTQYVSFYIRQQRTSKVVTHIFEVRQHDRTSADTLRLCSMYIKECTSGNVGHFRFLPVRTSYNIDTTPIEWLDPEHLIIAGGISLLYILYTSCMRYKYFKVQDCHHRFSTSGSFPFGRTLLQLFPLDSWTPKTYIRM